MAKIGYVQWVINVKKANVCINFLSATYVQSKSCALEWNYAFKEQEKNGKKILNVTLGGGAGRKAIDDLPFKGDGAVAEVGGAKISMYLRACGQSLSVYPVERNQIIADEIQKKLQNELDFADMDISCLPLAQAVEEEIDKINPSTTENETKQCSTIPDLKPTQCVIIGNSNVGKSCILGELCNDGLGCNRTYTTSVQYYADTIIEEEKWSMWDIPGHERFQSIATIYYREADVMVVVYDVTDRETFENVDYWINLIRDYAPFSAVCFLVGNKIDCISAKRRVTKDEGLSFAAKRGLCYFEVSALHGTNFPAFKQKLFQRRRLAIRDRERQKEMDGKLCFCNIL